MNATTFGVQEVGSLCHVSRAYFWVPRRLAVSEGAWARATSEILLDLGMLRALGLGPWLVICGVTRKVSTVIIMVGAYLITLLITSPGPPSGFPSVTWNPVMVETDLS